MPHHWALHIYNLTFNRRGKSSKLRNNFQVLYFLYLNAFLSFLDWLTFGHFFLMTSIDHDWLEASQLLERWVMTATHRDWAQAFVSLKLPEKQKLLIFSHSALQANSCRYILTCVHVVNFLLISKHLVLQRFGRVSQYREVTKTLNYLQIWAHNLSEFLLILNRYCFQV